MCCGCGSLLRQRGRIRRVVAGDHRHPGALRNLLRENFRAHLSDRFDRGPHIEQASAATILSKGSIFGEKTIARVDRIGATGAGDVEQTGAIQIALGGFRGTEQVRFIGKVRMGRIAVGFRIDRDGAQAEISACAHDAHSNFTTVGNEELLHGPRTLTPTLSLWEREEDFTCGKCRSGAVPEAASWPWQWTGPGHAESPRGQAYRHPRAARWSSKASPHVHTSQGSAA